MGDIVVDVHSHIYVPSYVRYLRERASPPFVRPRGGVDRFVLFDGDDGVAMHAGFTSLAGKLAFMDEAGIDHTVLSLGNPWLDIEPGESSIDLARAINADLARVRAEAGGRISTMAVLPNHDVDSALGALREIGDAGHVALSTSTQICGLALDSPELYPLWEEASRRELPFLIHPVTGLGGAAAAGYGQALTLALAFPFETTAAIARMILAGVFDAFPRLKVIAAHGAGALPYLEGRLRRAVEVDSRTPPGLPRIPEGLYADAIIFSPSALRHCIDVLSPTRVMFGTDHPFPIAAATDMRRNIEAAATSAADREAILAGNSQRLFALPVHDGVSR